MMNVKKQPIISERQATHKRDDRRLRARVSACPECRRQSVDLREMTTLAAPANESEAARLNRVLEDFNRVLDAQLDECDKWESSGDLYIVYSQLVN
jgi:hypothetical protein